MPLRSIITDNRDSDATTISTPYLRIAPAPTDPTQTDILAMGAQGGDGMRVATFGGVPDYTLTLHKVGAGHGVPVDADGYWSVNKD